MATKKGGGATRGLKSGSSLQSAEALPVFVCRIKIALKAGVSDPEGNNTLKALHLLGFESVAGVSTERIVHLRLKAARQEDALAEAERACRRLLTNPIIHDYRIEVEASR